MPTSPALYIQRQKSTIDKENPLIWGDATRSLRTLNWVQNVQLQWHLSTFPANECEIPGGFVVLWMLLKKFRLPPSAAGRSCQMVVSALYHLEATKRHQAQRAPATRPVSRPSSINLNLFRSSSILAQIAYFLPSSSGVPCDVPANGTHAFSQPALIFCVSPAPVGNHGDPGSWKGAASLREACHAPSWRVDALHTGGAALSMG